MKRVTLLLLLALLLVVVGPVQGQTPTTADDYYGRGFARQRKGDLDGAIADYTKALEIDPRYTDAYDGRADARRAKGDLDGAIADYTKCIMTDPGYADCYNALAWLLATASRDEIRDGKKAVEYRKAAELTIWKDANALDTLAAAYAETGDFEEAIKWENKALSLPDFAKTDEERVRQRLKLYTERKRIATIDQSSLLANRQLAIGIWRSAML